MAKAPPISSTRFAVAHKLQGEFFELSGAMGAIAARFFSENRFGAPGNYSAGLPSYFPSYCVITQ